MPELVEALEFVDFREAMDGRAESYDIAFIDGACSRESQAAKLREIRRRAKKVVPLGACAVQGCVHALKNRHPNEKRGAQPGGDRKKIQSLQPVRGGPVEMRRLDIAVRQITRVEGHGDLILRTDMSGVSSPRPTW